MNERTPTLFRLAASVLLACSTSAWGAEPPTGGPFIVPAVSVTVDAKGFDLSTPSGAQRLHREIVAAAQRACGMPPRAYKGVARRRFEVEHVQPCVQGAVRSALEQVAAVTGRDLEQVAGLGRSAGQVAESR
jgi:UrcA family protein